MKFGIISLSEHPDNILMWSYYAQNSGFVIKFKTVLLPKQFYGPFPINYSDKWNKIDLTDNEKIDSLCALYQTNIKNIKWLHEDEWRYLTFKKDGKYHPYCGNSNYETNGRKFSYDPESVEEVILGYDFFKLSEFVKKECTPEYFIIKIQNCSSQDNWKIKFLNHIIQNSIKCSQVKRSRDEYRFGFYNINLEQLKNNRFKITNPVLS